MALTPSYYRPQITTMANAQGLDPMLVEALIWIESRSQADAFRYEPQFWIRYRLATKPEYRDSCPRRVSSSYGLMQLMYPTAKDLGFMDEPELLFLPKINLLWGCRHLKNLLLWADTYHAVPLPDRLQAALAAYNGGKGGNTPGTALRPDNHQYATRVLATLSLLREPTIPV